MRWYCFVPFVFLSKMSENKYLILVNCVTCHNKSHKYEIVIYLTRSGVEKQQEFALHTRSYCQLIHNIKEQILLHAIRRTTTRKKKNLVKYFVLCVTRAFTFNGYSKSITCLITVKLYPTPFAIKNRLNLRSCM